MTNSQDVIIANWSNCVVVESEHSDCPTGGRNEFDFYGVTTVDLNDRTDIASAKVVFGNVLGQNHC